MREAMRTSQTLLLHLLRDNLCCLVVRANGLISHAALLALELRCSGENKCLKMSGRLCRDKDVIIGTAGFAPHDAATLRTLVKQSSALAVFGFIHVRGRCGDPTVIRNR